MRVLTDGNVEWQKQFEGRPCLKFNTARPRSRQGAQLTSPLHLPEIQENLECPADPEKSRRGVSVGEEERKPHLSPPFTLAPRGSVVSLPLLCDHP